MIGLLDCNNFYVSCERLFNPKLLEKPVIILSNNDGCVISRSEEAKQIGVKMGEPFFKLKQFINHPRSKCIPGITGLAQIQRNKKDIKGKWKAHLDFDKYWRWLPETRVLWLHPENFQEP